MLIWINSKRHFAAFVSLLLLFTFLFPQSAHATTRTVFITSSNPAYQLPVDMDSTSNATVEVISGGGGGGNGVLGVAGAGGGGGGTYAKKTSITSFTPGEIVTAVVGVGGGAASVGSASYFCNATTNCASLADTSVIVGAPGAGASTGTAGGTARILGAVGDVINSGGNGGTYTGSSSGAGGGGGAGGPLGTGGTGGANAGAFSANGAAGSGGGGNGGGTNGGAISGVQSTGGAGGNNQAGSGSGAGGIGSNPGAAGTVGGGGGGAGAGAASVSNTGGAGGPGTDWDSTHGSGGGAGAGSGGADVNGAANGSNGGLYGGGGSGGTASVHNAGTGGSGASGLIAITYTQSTTPHIIVANPGSQITNVAFSVTGSYSVNTPAALDYQIDGGSWIAATTPTITGGSYLFSITIASAGSHTVGVRDHSATSVNGTSPSFTVAAPSGIITVTTPSSQSTNTPFTLAGTYSTITPSALDYEIDTSGVWVAAVSPTIGSGIYSFSATIAHAGSHTLSVRDHNNQTTFGVSGAFQTNPNILPNNAAFSFSPFNWLTGSAATISNNGGAYFTIQFTGSTCELNFDTSLMVASASEIYWQLDGLPATKTLVSLINQASTLNIPCPIPADVAWFPSHYLRVEIKATTEFVSPSGSGTRWSVTANPNVAVKFTGLTIANGSTVTALQASNNKKIIWYGDSVVEGYLTTGNTETADIDKSDNTLGFAYLTGRLLGADIGVIGFGGTGWSTGGQGGVPGLNVFYNNMWSGQARALTPCPDAFVIQMGNNNGSSNTTTLITGIINGLETACASTPIILTQPIITPAQGTFIQAGIAASMNPSQAHYVATPSWLISAQTQGGGHPNSAQNLANLAPRFAAAIRPYLTTQPYNHF